MIPLDQPRWLPAGLLVLGLSAVVPVTAESRVARAALRDEIRYSPPAHDAEIPPSPATDDIVEMAPFTVTESMLRRDLERTVKRDEAQRADAAFSWRKGGLIRSRRFGANGQMDLGLWPTLLEREAGPIKAQDVMLKVDLLRFSW